MTGPTLGRRVSRSNRFVPALLLAVAAAALAGCGDDPQPAATVDGTPVTQQEIVDELEAIQGNADYVAGVEANGTDVLGSGEGTFDAGFIAGQLGVRIQYALASNEVDRRELSADDECRQAATDALAQRFGPLSPSGDGLAVLDGFEDAYRDYLVERETDVLLLQGDLIGQPCVAGTAVEDYFEANRESFPVACSAHIQLATAAEAQDVLAQLAAGADLATLARERSLDTESGASGGELPCVTPGTLIPEFDQLLFGGDTGRVPTPVETQFGFHVLDILSVGPAESLDVEGVEQAVTQALAEEAQASVGAWFSQAVADAEVEVDPRYGDWDPTAARIDRRPSGAATTTTLDPLAGG